MMFFYSLRTFVLGALLIISSLLIGCGETARESNSSSMRATTDTAVIALYQGELQAPWQLELFDHESNTDFLGQKIVTGAGFANLTPVTKDFLNDALHLEWNDSWRAGINFKGTKTNVAQLLGEGVVSFDLNVLELASGGVDVVLQCGDQCERRFPLTEHAFTAAGNGWHKVNLALSCFYRVGDNFTQVTQPFSLQVGGKGAIEVANIVLKPQGEANIACVDYRTVSVTPSKLDEYWARSWWEPRHKEKLARLAEGNVDLLMMGDSITQGWEGAGKSVWEKYYLSRNAVNLGYGGDRTENLLWRIQHGEVDGVSPKAVVLMIGTNNTGHRHEDPSTTALGIKKVLAELRLRLPESKILLLAIFPRSEQPDDFLRGINNQVNSIIKDYADNKYIFFANLETIFLDSNGFLSKKVMPDLLHLNEQSYQAWAEAMEPLLSPLLDEGKL